MESSSGVSPVATGSALQGAVAASTAGTDIKRQGSELHYSVIFAHLNTGRVRNGPNEGLF